MKDFDEKEYEELIGRIFSRFPSYQVVGGNAYHPGLGNMEAFDRELGHPHRNYRTIHVAGTNGKGSVSNMLAAALDSMGFKVGLYTSPHLTDFRERARVVGKGMIPGQKVMEFCSRWWDVIDGLDLSFFEITTSMAFDWFASEGVDFAVVETGLGGRLDSTNIISPELSVITNIGLDHCSILGDTIAQIASEKAGIIKPETAVVIGESGEDSDIIFRAKADVCGSEIAFADRDSDFPRGLLATLLEGLDLKGCYQEKNLNTALAALTVMHRRGITPKSAMAPEVVDAILHTAEITGFRGRWETICSNPLTIGDIGHNAHGLKYNFAQLEKMVRDEGYELTIVYGSVADKDWRSVVKMIPRCARVIFTNAAGPRALPAAQAREAFDGDAEVCGSVAEAMSLARKLSEGLRKPLIYVGGSTYVLSEALRALEAAEE